MSGTSVRPSSAREPGGHGEPPRPLRIAILADSLTCGGAENAAVRLAAGLRERSHDVTMITLLDESTDFLQVPPGVERVVLGCSGRSSTLWIAYQRNREHVLRLRAVLAERRPDVVLAFVHRAGTLAVLAARPLGIPVVISERTDPRSARLSPFWRVLRSYAYRAAAGVVANSREVAGWLRNWLPPERVFAIPNMVDVYARHSDEEPEFGLPGTPFVLALGRLVPLKGHADLIDAFRRVGAPRGWSLVVLGDGESRSDLEARVREEGIEERVWLPGRTRNPWPYLRHADLFVLTSRYEGFPNALLEAMAGTTCCVSYDCRSGPREMLTDGTNGFLVEVGDVDALSERMGTLMDSPSLRTAIASRARERALDFSPGRIVPRWEALLRGAASREEFPDGSRTARAAR